MPQEWGARKAMTSNPFSVKPALLQIYGCLHILDALDEVAPRTFPKYIFSNFLNGSPYSFSDQRKLAAAAGIVILFTGKYRSSQYSSSIVRFHSTSKSQCAQLTNFLARNKGIEFQNVRAQSDPSRPNHTLSSKRSFSYIVLSLQADVMEFLYIQAYILSMEISKTQQSLILFRRQSRCLSPWSGEPDVAAASHPYYPCKTLFTTIRPHIAGSEFFHVCNTILCRLGFLGW
ncbi:hypothetical protein AVEN_268771-1 [Araneus ventricosus]|uniref:Uncharacterized protein n=1 Tax=Araneus ventricosus TaxID=182803 RepID=A0A4Y2K970_ARAVE|nr:hypothetical protein AVEN_268771-1 [Araneus ventricosus]